MARWPADRLLGAVPSVSAWSPGGHLHHLSAINAQVLGSLLRALEGDDVLTPGGSPTWIGRLLLGLGRLPRGKGRAPKRFHPPDDLTPESVAQVLAEARRSLDAIGPHLGRLAALDGRMTHSLLGRFDAVEWLRFARIHTAHHLRIARDVETRRAASLQTTA
ncbi:MAG: DinB family protein [Rhodothermales bacterium]|nr:DinB family protein [Rhodothermales bacterium]